MDDDFDVLARGVKDLGHALIGHQFEEWLQVEARCQRVDQRGDAGRRHLDEAQHRPKRGFANELGVYRYESGFREVADDRIQFFLRCYQVHQNLVAR